MSLSSSHEWSPSFHDLSESRPTKQSKHTTQHNIAHQSTSSYAIIDVCFVLCIHTLKWIEDDELVEEVVSDGHLLGARVRQYVSVGGVVEAGYGVVCTIGLGTSQKHDSLGVQRLNVRNVARIDEHLIVVLFFGTTFVRRVAVLELVGHLPIILSRYLFFVVGVRRGLGGGVHHLEDIRRPREQHNASIAEQFVQENLLRFRSKLY